MPRRLASGYSERTAGYARGSRPVWEFGDSGSEQVSTERCPAVSQQSDHTISCLTLRPPFPFYDFFHRELGSNRKYRTSWVPIICLLSRPAATSLPRQTQSLTPLLPRAVTPTSKSPMGYHLQLLGPSAPSQSSRLFLQDFTSATKISLECFPTRVSIPSNTKAKQN